MDFTSQEDMHTRLDSLKYQAARMQRPISADNILDMKDDSVFVNSGPDSPSPVRKLSTESMYRCQDEGFKVLNVLSKSNSKLKKQGRQFKRRFGVVSPPPDAFYSDVTSPDYVPDTPSTPTSSFKHKVKKFTWNTSFIGAYPRQVSYEEDLELRLRKVIQAGLGWKEKWINERDQKTKVIQEHNELMSALLKDYKETTSRYEKTVSNLQHLLAKVRGEQANMQITFKTAFERSERQRHNALDKARTLESNLSSTKAEIKDLRFLMKKTEEQFNRTNKRNQELENDIQELKQKLDRAEQEHQAQNQLDYNRDETISKALLRLYELEGEKSENTPLTGNKNKRLNLSRGRRRMSLEESTGHTTTRMESLLLSVHAVMAEMDIHTDTVLTNHNGSPDAVTSPAEKESSPGAEVHADRTRMFQRIRHLSHVTEENGNEATNERDMETGSSRGSSVDYVDDGRRSDTLPGQHEIDPVFENESDKASFWSKQDVRSKRRAFRSRSISDSTTDNESIIVYDDIFNLDANIQGRESTGDHNTHSLESKKKKGGKKLGRLPSAKGLADLLSRRKKDHKHDKNRKVPHERDLDAMSNDSEISKDMPLSDLSPRHSNKGSLSNSRQSLASLDSESDFEILSSQERDGTPGLHGIKPGEDVVSMRAGGTPSRAERKMKFKRRSASLQPGDDGGLALFSTDKQSNKMLRWLKGKVKGINAQ